MKIIAKRLKEARNRKGLTQEEVARRLGVTRSVIARYESGLNDPSTEKLTMLAEMYGVSVDYLLGRTNDPHLHTAAVPNKTPNAHLSGIKRRNTMGNGIKPQTAQNLPDWVSELPSELQEFIREEAKSGWPYIKLIYDAKLNQLKPEDIARILSTLIDVKKRIEQDSKQQH